LVTYIPGLNQLTESDFNEKGKEKRKKKTDGQAVAEPEILNCGGNIYIL